VGAANVLPLIVAPAPVFAPPANEPPANEAPADVIPVNAPPALAPPANVVYGAGYSDAKFAAVSAQLKAAAGGKRVKKMTAALKAGFTVDTVIYRIAAKRTAAELNVAEFSDLITGPYTKLPVEVQAAFRRNLLRSVWTLTNPFLLQLTFIKLPDTVAGAPQFREMFMHKHLGDLYSAKKRQADVAKKLARAKVSHARSKNAVCTWGSVYCVDIFFVIDLYPICTLRRLRGTFRRNCAQKAS
jgi:hypothetical protein